jgi:hypothetical protein
VGKNRPRTFARRWSCATPTRTHTSAAAHGSRASAFSFLARLNARRTLALLSATR